MAVHNAFRTQHMKKIWKHWDFYECTSIRTHVIESRPVCLWLWTHKV